MKDIPPGPPQKLKKPKKLTQKTSRIVAYLTPIQKIRYENEAKKRGITLSSLIRISLYEKCFEVKRKTSEEEIIVKRQDRKPKGALNSVHQVNYREVVKEIKGGIKLASVPKEELRHVYNVVGTGKVVE